MTDWKTCPAVERNPLRISGAWAFAGTESAGVRALREPRERRHGRRIRRVVPRQWTAVRFSRCSITRHGRSERKRRLEAAVRSGNTRAAAEPPSRSTPSTRWRKRAGRTGTTASCSNLAERDGYEVLVTTDRNIRCQQDLEGRQLGVVVLLPATAWSEVRLRASEIDQAVCGGAPRRDRRGAEKGRLTW